MALTESDKSWISGKFEEVAEKVWGRKLRNPYTNVDQPAADFERYAPSKQPHADTQKQIEALSKDVARLTQLVESLTAK